jgi:hypothetical protein
MRTKALLLTAALSAAGVATSMAQVYSVNAVGYVNLSLGPGLSMIANPLNGTNNHLNTVLALPNDSSVDGVNVFRFNVASQNYSDAAQWISNFGWFSSNPTEDYILNPGEGFFFQNIYSTPVNVTFVGEVPQGTLSNPYAGANNLSLRSSIVPQEAPLGGPDIPVAGTLGFSAVDGDNLYPWNYATQGFEDAILYIGGFGWFRGAPSAVGPEGPTLKVANSLFIQGAPTSPLSRTWIRTFSVN